MSTIAIFMVAIVVALLAVVMVPFLIIQFQLRELKGRVNRLSDRMGKASDAGVQDEKSGDSWARKVIKFFASAPPSAKHQHDWVIASGSATGLHHLRAKEPIPCQDSYSSTQLSQDAGIIVVCDGAGSAKNSHLGSRFVADEAIKVFSEIALVNDFHHGVIPTQQEWDDISTRGLKKLYHDLHQFAQEEGLQMHTLACTVIVVMYLPNAVLMTHIGDGRAAYMDSSGKWQAFMEPHSGEEANQTIFLSSSNWLEGGFEMQSIPVPESRVITERSGGVAALSDGCEKSSFELGYLDKEQDKFIPKNDPYPKFFGPVTETILKKHLQGDSQEEINAAWKIFLEGGMKKLKNELDDKTMVIAVRATHSNG